MRKINQIFFKSIVLLLDFALIIAAFYLCFFIRYGVNIPAVNFEPFKRCFLGLGFIYILAFSFAGMFQKRFASHWQLCRKVFLGVVFGTLFSVVFLYVFRIKWASFPSSIFILVIPVGSVLIAIANIIAFRLAKRLITKLIVVGQNKDEEIFINRSRLQVHRVDNIIDILNYEDFDEVLICERIHEDSQLNLLTYLLARLDINVSFSPNLYAELLSDNLNQGNTLKSIATLLGRKSDMEEFLMTAVDTIGSFSFLILIWPLMLVIILLIKVTSKGPVFYTQQRIGKNGRKFTIYKFRSMVENAEKMSGFQPAEEDDARITGVGRILRSTRIDELPQLWNILKGEMSLVGPRPENLYRVETHKALQGLRLAVKPGLTGLAQIRSLYDLNPEHKIKYDYLYIQRRSLLLNIILLARTVPIMFSKKGW